MHHIPTVLIVSLQLSWKLIFIVLWVQLKGKEWAKSALCVLIVSDDGINFSDSDSNM